MNGTDIETLCHVLGAERALLTRLVSSLDQGDELDRLLRRVADLELQRAIAARAVAIGLGFEGDANLVDLIAAAPDGWTAVLEDHHRALVAGTEELSRRPAPAPDQSPDIDGRPSSPSTRVDARPTVQRSLRDFLA